MQLEGKRVLVTGNSSGISAGIARSLAREGARVVMHGRDAARTRAVVDEIVEAGAGLRWPLAT